MTEHDRVRKERAEKVQKTIYTFLPDEEEDLLYAIAGLQSTDDPSLVPLHDELMDRLESVRKRKET